MEQILESDFINATKLVKASGRDMSLWLRNQYTKKVIKKLETETATKIIHIKRGGNEHSLQGTFIHPKLLPCLEQWLVNGRGNYEMSRHENDFKDLLNKTFKDIFVFQCQVKIDNYRLDFYCDELKLVIEYDEKHHNNKNNEESDIVRQKYLEEKYNYKFIRVKQGKEIEGINKIIKFTMGIK